MALSRAAFLSQNLTLVVWPTTAPSRLVSSVSMLAMAARVAQNQCSISAPPQR
jgi:hypothetical protein